MKPGEEKAVCKFTNTVFSVFVSPLYSTEGTKAFQKTTVPEILKQDCAVNGHLVHLAFLNESLVGVLKTKEINHVSWLFVDGLHQKKGIGKGLIKHTIGYIIKESPEIKELTVNSSPNSYDAYKSIGFSVIGPEAETNGIRYTPFKLLFENFC